MKEQIKYSDCFKLRKYHQKFVLHWIFYIEINFFSGFKKKSIMFMLNPKFIIINSPFFENQINNNFSI